jgi:hypothetical protein
MVESGSTTAEVLHLNLFGHFKPCDFTEKSKFSLISPLNSAFSAVSPCKSLPVEDEQIFSIPLSLSPLTLPQSESQSESKSKSLTDGSLQSDLPLSLPLSLTPVMVSAENTQSHTQGPYTQIKKWSDLSNNTHALCSLLEEENLIEKKSLPSLLEIKMNNIQNLGSLSICRRYFIVEEV